MGGSRSVGFLRDAAIELCPTQARDIDQITISLQKNGAMLHILILHQYPQCPIQKFMVAAVLDGEVGEGTQ